MSEPKFHVGQEVWVRRNRYSTDALRDEPVEVVKVGRTLVFVRLYGRDVAFRQDTGVINDQYGHQRILTDEDRDRETAEADMVKRLEAAGLKHTVTAAVLVHRVGLERAARIAEILEEDR